MNPRYLLLLLILLTGQSIGGETAQSYDRINLSVSAGEEIDNDTLIATLFAQQEGSDPAKLGAQVNRLIKAAVETAKREPEIKIQTLDYQTSPVYHNNSLSGWRVRQSIRLESQDAALISRLMGKLQQHLSISSIRYAVSPAQRQQAETRLIRQAIQQFQDRAQLITKAMERSDYRMVVMNISHNGGIPRSYSVNTMALQKESAPTLEAGTQRLEVHINGTIELKPN